jgi:hypothetical protein
MPMQRIAMWLRYFVTVSAVAMLGMALPAMAGPLDGKTFAGEFGNKGSVKPIDKDDLIFKDGKFESSFCRSTGFGTAPYTATAQGNTIIFESEIANAQGQKLHWKGTVKGSVLEGTITSSVPGQPPAEQWVKAKLKK